MISRIILTTLLLATAHGLSAQNDESPENRRYLNPVFDEVIFTENIVYATKRNDLNNKKKELKLRVFEPKDDSLAARPLFLLTPGGAFMVTGDDWMNDVAEELAKAGFVVALNKYRLSSSIDTPEKYAVALRKAMTDQTDALRFLINDARGKNRFRIDPDKIFIGGHSAGAITSMHTAYLNSEDAISPQFREIFHSEKNALLPRDKKIPLLGVINLAGMLGDLSIINRNDVPVLSIHGEKDAVVTADRDQNVFGSTAIHEYANTVGTYSELFIIKGARHNDTAIPALCEECVPIMKRFMYNQLMEQEQN